ncbi:MAG: hypothetical protein AAF725_27525 [Acidobacteriota bacterium]
MSWRTADSPILAGAILAQCVGDDDDLPLEFTLQAKSLAPAEAIVFVEFGCRFFEQPACAGAAFAESSAIIALIGEQTPAWVPPGYDLRAPAGSTSALCEVLTSSPQTGFELFLDALPLVRGTPTSASIFSDDFESGDAAAWR